MMTMNGGMAIGGGNLFTLNEESEVDFDSVSELDRDTLYAPMNYQNQNFHGNNNNNNNNGNYGNVPKIYSNLNGIGGPPPPPSYMSSSSSNATSNSASTASNNTTTQTIATCTTTGNYNNQTNSSSGVGGSNNLSHSSGSINTTSQSNFSALVSNQVISNGIINSERHTSNACQFYYPTPSQALDSFPNTTLSSVGSHMPHNMNSLNTDIDETIPNQTAQNVIYQPKAFYLK